MVAIVGTSGWQYDDWKDVLYSGVPKTRWLERYATVFPAVEVNNTFYNLPKEKTFENWAARTPEGFVFVCKASRYITHIRRIDDVAEAVTLFVQRARLLGEKLGAVLYQLPPSMQRDVARFESFLDVLPPHPPAAIEFRNDSWYDETVYALMRSHDVALCVADSPKHRAPLVTTAGWAYLRLHGTEGYGLYDDDTIGDWSRRVASLDADPIYVFFDNDVAGNAVGNALQLTAAVEALGVPVARPAVAH